MAFFPPPLSLASCPIYSRKTSLATSLSRPTRNLAAISFFLPKEEEKEEGNFSFFYETRDFTVK